MTSFNFVICSLWNYKVITKFIQRNKKQNKENDINYSKKEIQLLLFTVTLFSKMADLEKFSWNYRRILRNETSRKKKILLEGISMEFKETL